MRYLNKVMSVVLSVLVLASSVPISADPKIKLANNLYQVSTITMDASDALSKAKLQGIECKEDIGELPAPTNDNLKIITELLDKLNDPKCNKIVQSIHIMGYEKMFDDAENINDSHAPGFNNINAKYSFIYWHEYRFVKENYKKIMTWIGVCEKFSKKLKTNEDLIAVKAGIPKCLVNMDKLQCMKNMSYLYKHLDLITLDETTTPIDPMRVYHFKSIDAQTELDKVDKSDLEFFSTVYKCGATSMDSRLDNLEQKYLKMCKDVVPVSTCNQLVSDNIKKYGSNSADYKIEYNFLTDIADVEVKNPKTPSCSNKTFDIKVTNNEFKTRASAIMKDLKQLGSQTNNPVSDATNQLNKLTIEKRELDELEKKYLRIDDLAGAEKLKLLQTTEYSNIFKKKDYTNSRKAMHLWEQMYTEAINIYTGELKDAPKLFVDLETKDLDAIKGLKLKMPKKVDPSVSPNATDDSSTVNKSTYNPFDAALKDAYSGRIDEMLKTGVLELPAWADENKVMDHIDELYKKKLGSKLDSKFPEDSAFSNLKLELKKSTGETVKVSDILQGSYRELFISSLLPTYTLQFRTKAMAGNYLNQTYDSKFNTNSMGSANTRPQVLRDAVEKYVGVLYVQYQALTTSGATYAQTTNTTTAIGDATATPPATTGDASTAPTAKDPAKTGFCVQFVDMITRPAGKDSDLKTAYLMNISTMSKDFMNYLKTHFKFKAGNQLSKADVGAGGRETYFSLEEEVDEVLKNIKADNFVSEDMFRRRSKIIDARKDPKRASGFLSPVFRNTPVLDNLFVAMHASSSKDTENPFNDELSVKAYMTNSCDIVTENGDLLVPLFFNAYFSENLLTDPARLKQYLDKYAYDTCTNEDKGIKGSVLKNGTILDKLSGEKLLEKEDCGFLYLCPMKEGKGSGAYLSAIEEPFSTMYDAIRDGINKRSNEINTPYTDYDDSKQSIKIATGGVTPGNLPLETDEDVEDLVTKELADEYFNPTENQLWVQPPLATSIPWNGIKFSLADSGFEGLLCSNKEVGVRAITMAEDYGSLNFVLDLIRDTSKYSQKEYMSGYNYFMQCYIYSTCCEFVDDVNPKIKNRKKAEELRDKMLDLLNGDSSAIELIFANMFQKLYDGLCGISSGAIFKLPTPYDIMDIPFCRWMLHNIFYFLSMMVIILFIYYIYVFAAGGMNLGSVFVLSLANLLFVILPFVVYPMFSAVAVNANIDSWLGAETTTALASRRVDYVKTKDAIMAENKLVNDSGTYNDVALRYIYMQSLNTQPTGWETKTNLNLISALQENIKKENIALKVNSGDSRPNIGFNLFLDIGGAVKERPNEDETDCDDDSWNAGRKLFNTNTLTIMKDSEGGGFSSYSIDTIVASSLSNSAVGSKASSESGTNEDASISISDNDFGLSVYRSCLLIANQLLNYGQLTYSDLLITPDKLNLKDQKDYDTRLVRFDSKDPTHKSAYYQEDMFKMDSVVASLIIPSSLTTDNATNLNSRYNGLTILYNNTMDDKYNGKWSIDSDNYFDFIFQTNEDLRKDYINNLIPLDDVFTTADGELARQVKVEMLAYTMTLNLVRNINDIADKVDDTSTASNKIVTPNKIYPESITTDVVTLDSMIRTLTVPRDELLMTALLNNKTDEDGAECNITNATCKYLTKTYTILIVPLLLLLAIAALLFILLKKLFVTLAVYLSIFMYFWVVLKNRKIRDGYDESPVKTLKSRLFSDSKILTGSLQIFLLLWVSQLALAGAWKFGVFLTNSNTRMGQFVAALLLTLILFGIDFLLFKYLLKIVITDIVNIGGGNITARISRISGKGLGNLTGLMNKSSSQPNPNLDNIRDKYGKKDKLKESSKVFENSDSYGKTAKLRNIQGELKSMGKKASDYVFENKQGVSGVKYAKDILKSGITKGKNSADSAYMKLLESKEKNLHKALNSASKIAEGKIPLSKKVLNVKNVKSAVGKTVGTGKVVAGTTERVAGTAMRGVGTVANAGGKVMSAAGSALTTAGSALSCIPVVGWVAGGVAGAAGAGMNIAGQGVSLAGQGVNAVGKGVNSHGKGLIQGGLNGKNGANAAKLEEINKQLGKLIQLQEQQSEQFKGLNETQKLLNTLNKVEKEKEFSELRALIHEVADGVCDSIEIGNKSFSLVGQSAEKVKELLTMKIIDDKLQSLGLTTRWADEEHVEILGTDGVVAGKMDSALRELLPVRKEDLPVISEVSNYDRLLNIECLKGSKMPVSDKARQFLSNNQVKYSEKDGHIYTTVPLQGKDIMPINALVTSLFFNSPKLKSFAECEQRGSAKSVIFTSKDVDVKGLLNDMLGFDSCKLYDFNDYNDFVDFTNNGMVDYYVVPNSYKVVATSKSVNDYLYHNGHNGKDCTIVKTSDMLLKKCMSDLPVLYGDKSSNSDSGFLSLRPQTETMLGINTRVDYYGTGVREVDSDTRSLKFDSNESMLSAIVKLNKCGYSGDIEVNDKTNTIKCMSKSPDTFNGVCDVLRDSVLKVSCKPELIDPLLAGYRKDVDYEISKAGQYLVYNSSLKSQVNARVTKEMASIADRREQLSNISDLISNTGSEVRNGVTVSFADEASNDLFGMLMNQQGVTTFVDTNSITAFCGSDELSAMLNGGQGVTMSRMLVGRTDNVEYENTKFYMDNGQVKTTTSLSSMATGISCGVSRLKYAVTPSGNYLLEHNGRFVKCNRSDIDLVNAENVTLTSDEFVNANVLRNNIVMKNSINSLIDKSKLLVHKKPLMGCVDYCIQNIHQLNNAAIGKAYHLTPAQRVSRLEVDSLLTSDVMGLTPNEISGFRAISDDSTFYLKVGMVVLEKLNNLVDKELTSFRRQSSSVVTLNEFLDIVMSETNNAPVLDLIKDLINYNRNIIR